MIMPQFYTNANLDPIGPLAHEILCTRRKQTYVSVEKLKIIIFNFVLLCLFLFVLLLYVPSQQLWSWRDGQFT